MSITLLPIRGLPEVQPGDDLAALIGRAVDLRDGDVVVVAQKVVSKAEGALVRLAPGAEAAVARRALVRQHAARVVVEAPWTTIVQTRHGLVCANAGIDASNAPEATVVLLPEDPDASARGLRDALRRRAGVHVAVVITDTFGRPWRTGQTDVAIGLAGLPAFRDERGGRDRNGMLLEATQVALADEVAAAADLVRRKADGVPAVVVRGLDDTPDEGARASQLLRPSAMDLFPRGRGAVADLLGGPPPVPLRDLSDDDVDRALSAARRTAGQRVTIEWRRGVPPAVLLASGGEPAELIALGATCATLVAALIDLGGTARPGASQQVGDRTTVLVEIGVPT